MSDEIFEFNLEIESTEQLEVRITPITQVSLPIDISFEVEEEI